MSHYALHFSNLDFKLFCLCIAGEKVTGIQYNPESLQGMRENLERILKFMATRKIRMHPVTSREILEGNLKVGSF